MNKAKKVSILRQTSVEASRRFVYLSNEQFRAKWNQAFSTFFLGIWLVGFGLYFLFIYDIAITNTTISRELIIETIVKLLAIAYGHTMLLLFAETMLLTTADIFITDEALWISLPFQIKIYINWKSFYNAKIIEGWHINLSRKNRKRLTSYAIYIPSLPFVFRFVGLAYRIGFKPIIVVTPEHNDYEYLVQYIREVIAGNK